VSSARLNDFFHVLDDELVRGLSGARRFADNSRVRIETATGDREYPEKFQKSEKSLSAF